MLNTFRPFAIALSIAAVAIAALTHPTAQRQTSNVILFVPDGMRAKMVDAKNAPALAALAAEGVTFENSHSLFPTFTMPNAAALATGHYIGDTGIFGNSLFVGPAIQRADGSTTPQIENDGVLGELDEKFGGTFIPESTLLAAARAAGVITAVLGKLGPSLLQDHTARDGTSTIIIDDATGTANGIPLAPAVSSALVSAGLGTRPPPRGDNARAGDFKTPGTTVANIVQQNWIAEAATRVVLPELKRRGKPFLMVYWSRDPDASQHNHGDSHGTIVPGINGPTVLAGIRNADDNLRRLRDALVALDLAATTNIVVAADHGFSTISKESRTSTAAARKYADVMENRLPPGFLAIDLAEALHLPLWDDARRESPVARDQHPRGTSLIGTNPAAPDVMIVPNGGSDLVYLPGRTAAAFAPRIVDALMAHDYVSGIFVDDRLGSIAGTLPISAINLVGTGAMPRPSLVVNFRSFSTGCAVATTCGAAVADVTMQQGQGFHGSFSRAETFNFMAASGPDFKTRFVDPMPVGNADVAPTLATLLGLKLPSNGALSGRVLQEALKDGRVGRFTSKTTRSAPGRAGLRTILQYQEVDRTRYFDVAGFPGRTLGLSEK